MYTSLPSVIKGLLTIMVILLGATGNFTFQNPIASNLSGLVDPSSHFLYSLLVSIDIFTIWTLVPGRPRLLLPDQGEARHLHGGGIRLVAGAYPRWLSAGRGLLLRER